MTDIFRTPDGRPLYAPVCPPQYVVRCIERVRGVAVYWGDGRMNYKTERVGGALLTYLCVDSIVTSAILGWLSDRLPEDTPARVYEHDLKTTGIAVEDIT